MNMFKKFVVAATFLSVATVVNAQEEGMKIGIRFGYSMQSVAYGMGMLGFGAGVGADIPIGPVFISPELAFLYRNNYSTTVEIGKKAVDRTQHEYAVSIPVMIKFFPGLSSFIAIGAKVDIPIAAEECLDNDCKSMNGKKPPYFTERADFDAGIVLNFGYVITHNFTLDFRYVYGLTPHHKYASNGVPGFKSDPLSSYGFGITYFFL